MKIRAVFLFVSVLLTWPIAFADTGTEAKLRAIEEKMLPNLRSIHGDDLGFRYLVEGYTEEDAENKTIVFDSIWIYTEEKIKKLGTPLPNDKKPLVEKFRADWAEYERVRYPK